MKTKTRGPLAALWQLSESSVQRWAIDEQQIIGLADCPRDVEATAARRAACAWRFSHGAHTREALPSLSLAPSEVLGLSFPVAMAGVVYVASGTEVFALESQGVWQVVATGNGGIAIEPICHAGTLFCAWQYDEKSVQVTSTTGLQTDWSVPFAGGSVRSFLVTDDEICILVTRPDSGNNGQHSTLLQVLSRSDLTIRQAAELQNAAAVTVAGTDLLVQSEEEFHVTPPGPYTPVVKGGEDIDKLRAHRIVQVYALGEGPDAGKIFRQDSGRRSIDSILVVSRTDLSIRALHGIAGSNKAVVATKPGFLVISDCFFRTSLEYFASWDSEPLLVGFLDGDHVCSATDDGKVVGLIEDNSLARFQAGLKGAPRPARQYTLWDFHVSSRTLTLRRVGPSGDFSDLIFRGNELIVHGPGSLACLEPLESVADATEDQVVGEPERPVGGPRLDTWGYEFDDPFVHALLEKLVSSDGTPVSEQFSNLDRAKRLSVITGARTWWVKEVCAAAEGADLDDSFGSDALRAALRFLLFEYIRLNKHRASIPAMLASSEVPPYFIDVLSWSSGEALSSSSAMQTAESLSQRWPAGVPDILTDAVEYERFVFDLMAARFLATERRTPLQIAIWRLVSRVDHRLRREVFLSYSHWDRETAQALARGLIERGISVSLDEWAPGSVVDDREVELWIAEHVACSDLTIYLVSAPLLRSRWVRRECNYEYRVLGFRPTTRWPIFVALDEKAMSLPVPEQWRIDARERPPGAVASPTLDVLASRVREMQNATAIQQAAAALTQRRRRTREKITRSLKTATIALMALGPIGLGAAWLATDNLPPRRNEAAQGGGSAPAPKTPAERVGSTFRVSLFIGRRVGIAPVLGLGWLSGDRPLYGL
jgi:hypothetical protein